LIKVNPEVDGVSLQVQQIRVGTMANFVYLVVEEGSKEALAVDSGWETKPIVDAANRLGATVRFVVATHEHFDHVSTLRELGATLGAKVVAHQDSPIECDIRVGDGEELKIGGKPVRVLHTPGHTEDSISLYDGTDVFTGDTLFVGTIGRFDKERAESMYKSIHEVILGLPSTTRLFPGHDYGEVPSRTLGEEKAANPYLMARDYRDFLSFFS
jgi:hydroxyacylglutathione hydrolase